MENVKEIKRGSKIRTGKESSIYTLTFLKDNVMLAYKYYSDWNDWFDNDPLTYDVIDVLLDQGERDEDEEIIAEAEKLKTVNVTKDLLKNTFEKLITEIDNTINVLENNCSIDIFQFAVENIENSLQKLDIITDYLYKRSELDYCNMYCDQFYNNVLYPVIGVSIGIIEEIVGKVNKIDNDWLKTTID